MKTNTITFVVTRVVGFTAMSLLLALGTLIIMSIFVSSPEDMKVRHWMLAVMIYAVMNGVAITTQAYKAHKG